MTRPGTVFSAQAMSGPQSQLNGIVGEVEQQAGYVKPEMFDGKAFGNIPAGAVASQALSQFVEKLSKGLDAKHKYLSDLQTNLKETAKLTVENDADQKWQFAKLQDEMSR